MGKLVQPVGPVLIISASGYWHRDQHHNNQTPRSLRQQLRTNPDKGSPRKRPELNPGRPSEQVPERERIGK